MTPAQAFGERLAQERREKAARERRDITQRTVAQAVGLTSAAISKYEAGDTIPSDDILGKIAAFYGVRPSWLRYGEGPKYVGKPPETPGSVLDLDPTRDHRLTEEEAARAEAQVSEKARASRPGRVQKAGNGKGKGRS